MKKIKQIGILLSLITIVVLGINYVFYEPTEINAFIASKIYKEPANSAFEDENFYNCVIDAYNSKNSSDVSYTYNLSDEELQTITSINCINRSITSTKGVEKIIKLESLDIMNNQLTEIDLSQNKKLTFLSLYNNKLTKLDLSKNENLETIQVGKNQLTSLDVSQNTKLTYLSLNSNQLIELDISENTQLTTLFISNNPLKNLDVSQNQNLTTLLAESNNLSELDLDNKIKLKEVSISKNQLTTLDISQNPALTSLNVDDNQLTTLDISQNPALTSLNVDDNQLTTLDISQNPALTSLSVGDNQLTTLDVSQNPALTSLSVGNNQLTTLDVSQNPALTSLNVFGNQLTELDVSQNLSLTRLNVYNNKYREQLFAYKGDDIVVGNNMKIPSHLNWELPIWSSKNNSIATVNSNGTVSTLKTGVVDIIGNSGSKYTTTSTINVVEITSNKYQINSEENYIYVGLDNDVDTIKENINLSHEEINVNVDLVNNKLQVKHNDDILKEFKFIKINSVEYDLTKEYIYVGTDKSYLDKINTVNGTKEVTANKLQIKYKDNVLKSYDLVSISSDNYDLTKEYIYTGTIRFDETKVNVINATREVISNKLEIKYEDIILQSYDLVSISSELYDLSNKYILSGGNTDLEEIEVINGTAILEDNIIKIKYDEYVLQTFYESAFDDINFYKCVIDAYNIKTSDVSYDHHLTDEQLNIITRLSCNGYNKSDDDKIVSTKGLEKLFALTELEVIYHSLTQLDISNNTELTTINLSANKLTELDVSKNKKLEHLGVNSNQLIELDVSGNETLIHFGLNDNQLTELDVSKNTSLKYLYVDNNQLSDLDVSNNLELLQLTLASNKFTKIDVRKNTTLNRLFVTNNQLIELDLSNNTELVDLLMYNNPYNEKLYIYKGNSIKIGNNIKLPNQLNWEKSTWLSKSNSIATVDNNGIVTAIKEGKVDVVGTVSGKYTTTSTINVIEITSDKYQINETENYIYVGLDNDIDTIKENINISNEEIDINVDLDNNKLQVKHNENILKKFKIIRLNSTEYDLTQEYIYVSNLTDEEILSKINIVNANKEISDNKLLIKYNNTLLDEYNLVKVISNGMPILDNSKIYISNSSEDKIRKSINVINAEAYIKEEKIEIIRDDTAMGEFDILSLNLGNLKESSKLIVIEDEIEYNNFISNITLNAELSYKILNDNVEVTTGNITEGMTLKIYYGNTEVDSFDITEEYVYIDEKLDIDETNKYLSDIEETTKVSDIISMIDTSGTITITNNKNEVITDNNLIGTGTKISIKLNTKTIEYQVIIQGDIDGDGRLALADIMKLANHIYKDQNNLKDVYLLAADYDRNGTHHLQDIMKIANKIYG